MEVVEEVDRFYTPSLVLFGFIGNILSICVFYKSSSSLSSSYYLSALALSDIGFLANLGAVWLTAEGLPLILHPISCPFVMYLGQVTCFLSVWFVVAFTGERFCAVCYPLSRPALCTVSRAKKLIASLTLFALFAFSYVWIIADVIQINLFNNSTNYSDSQQHQLDDDESNVEIRYRCSVPSQFHEVSMIANHVDSFLTLILPFFLITFLNIRITICVWKLRKERTHIVALSSSQSKYLVSEDRHRSHAAESKVTKTLLLVSTVFLVLNLPSHAVRATAFIQQGILGKDVGSSPQLHIAQQWANILFNTNFSINFLLYCVSGKNFRVSLLNLFKLKKRNFQNRAPSSYCPSKKNEFRRGKNNEHFEMVETKNKNLENSPTRKKSFYPSTFTEVETYA